MVYIYITNDNVIQTYAIYHLDFFMLLYILYIDKLHCSSIEDNIGVYVMFTDT